LTDLQERFWKKVDKTDTCWLWTKGKNPKGYGSFWYVDRDRGAHRVAYEWAHGPIPEGMLLDHKCHVRHCVRPSHMRLATNKQNAENRKGAKAGTKSGVRGVSWHGGGKWQANVGHHGKLHYLGLFETIAEAEEVVIAKRLELFTHNFEEV